MELDRDELVSMIAYALWRNRQARPKGHDLEDYRLWARHVVEHLELCQVRWSRPPAPPPGPMPMRGKADE